MDYYLAGDFERVRTKQVIRGSKVLVTVRDKVWRTNSQCHISFKSYSLLCACVHALSVLLFLRKISCYMNEGNVYVFNFNLNNSNFNFSNAYSYLSSFFQL